MPDTTTAQPTVVTCDNCQRATPLADATATRETKYPAVKEIGVLCPHCGRWTHAFFETPLIAAERQRLVRHRAHAGDSAKAMGTWQRSRKRFNRVFDCENRRWRKELAVDVASSGP